MLATENEQDSFLQATHPHWYAINLNMLSVSKWHEHLFIRETLYISPGGFVTRIVFVTTFVALAAGVNEAHIAIASTGLYSSLNIGGLVGASLASNVLQASLRTGLDIG